MDEHRTEALIIKAENGRIWITSQEDSPVEMERGLAILGLLRVRILRTPRFQSNLAPAEPGYGNSWSRSSA